MKKHAWLILFLLCLGAGLVLGVTHELTQRAIERRAVEGENAAYAALLPGAESFEALAVPEGEAIDGVQILSCHRALRAGEAFGMIVTTSVAGYRSPIEVTLGIAQDGGVAGVSCGGEGFAETVGLGELVREEAFTGQFAGLRAPVAVKQDGGAVDAVSGATVSSRAVCEAINAALAYFADVGE